MGTEQILCLPINEVGRDFVVGDIHGCQGQLAQALKEVEFDTRCDRLFCVGDLIDRGPHNEVALNLLAHSCVYAVRGNHEDMLLDIGVNAKHYPRGFLEENGAGWWKDISDSQREAYLKVFRRLPVAIEVQTHRGSVGFVHAEVPIGMDWNTFKSEVIKGNERVLKSALWGRTRFKRGDKTGVAGIDRLFVGHTIQKNQPIKLGNIYYIDTGAFVREIYGEIEYGLTLSELATATRVIIDPSPRDRAVKVVPNDVKVKTPFGKYSL